MKAVISRLTEIIFVQAVRAWIESQPAGQGGWLGALRDPQIGAALELMHRTPERSWSVSTLAREVAKRRVLATPPWRNSVPEKEAVAAWARLLAGSPPAKGKLTTAQKGQVIGYLRRQALAEIAAPKPRGKPPRPPGSWRTP